MARRSDIRPPREAAATRLSRPRYARLRGDWQKAYDRLPSDPDGAITAAKTLMEAACKHALDETGVSYGKADDLPKLYGLAAQRLGISPGAQADDLFRAVFGAAHTVVGRLGELRNNVGDAHGKGRGALSASRAQAELAVNLAGSVASFLIDTLESYLSATRRLTVRGDAVLVFEASKVWRLSDHARNSREWQPVYGERNPKPALLLVGDAGVYLMSNGLPPISYRGLVPKEGEDAEIPYLIAPAEGCNPDCDNVDDWWPIHNAIAGGDDFAVALPLDEFQGALEKAQRSIVLVGTEYHMRYYSDAEFASLPPDAL